jgi:sodium transport system permease protein
VVPAVCEELAFRGFILSGFRHLGHKWRAIILSALFFGLTHGILQQSLITCLVGLVIAYVAIHSGSILPGIVFHVLHNSLLVAMTKITPAALDRWPVLGILMSTAEGGGHVYHWPAIAGGAVVAALLLAWFARLPYAKSPEEQLQEAIRRGLTDDQ